VLLDHLLPSFLTVSKCSFSMDCAESDNLLVCHFILFNLYFLSRILSVNLADRNISHSLFNIFCFNGLSLF